MSKKVGNGRSWTGKQRLIVAGLMALSGLLLFSFGGLVLNAYNLNQQADVLRKEIAVLKAESEELEKQAAFLESDQGLEMLAREQLGWTKTGETGVVVVPSEGQEEITHDFPAPKQKERQNWQRWWDLFFGK